MNTTRIAHDGTTWTWQTLKSVAPGQRIAFNHAGYPTGNRTHVVTAKTIASMVNRAGRTITFTDGTTEWGGTATKYWVAAAVPAAPTTNKETTMPRKPAAPKADAKPTIPAGRRTFQCVTCEAKLPIVKFPTKSGSPEVRIGQCRKCRDATKTPRQRAA